MTTSTSHNNNFPLEQLFLRLEVAGFALSPADRIRALKILDGSVTAYLNKPEQLKKLLAPVLARSAAEQAKFYDIFDLYFKEINKPYEPKTEEKEPNYYEWVSWLFLLLAAGLLLFGWYSIREKEPVGNTPPSIYIEGPENVYVGDTVSFLNLSKFAADSSALKWKWTYGTPGETPELIDTTHVDWVFNVPPLTSDIYQKEVRLQLEYLQDDSLHIYERNQNVTILCAAPPDVKRIIGLKRAKAGENLTFTAAVGKESLGLITINGRKTINGSAKNWTFEWDFGDGSEKEDGHYFKKHTFKENGLYKIRLTVIDTSLVGFCTTSHVLEVKVGAEKAFLPLARLHKDQLKAIAVWDWAYYLILALFGIGIVFHWGRWLVQNRKVKQKKQQETPQQKTLHARFEFNDKAPYIIPLRDQNQQIRSSSEHLNFADALRLRQIGLRKEIDVSSTLHSTINSGGFPSVQFKYATQPSEYLFLIDEQCRASHLGRLFKYLAESLREQDVLMEVFYYRLHFNRFWNHYHTSGISLDRLQKEYPNYRLVVLGDLHELIDPYAKNQVNLRLEHVNTLQQWSHRLLLSPVPPVSWSYREQLLARVFNVFPADVEGIAAAALHLENGLKKNIDDQNFSRWTATQVAQRHDNDTEHRRWKRWRDIKKYLSAYDPDLTRWFKALAVFPMHSWEMTIAIGRALGIQITYDKLLQLARIPTLQKDRFQERLRQELLSVLDKEDEKSARQAVRRELDAVKAISSGSAASRDIETSLAIQAFALDPEAAENQDTIRFLLEKGMLNPAQEKELDGVSSKHIEAEKPATKAGTATTKKPTTSIREWLNADQYTTIPDKKRDNIFNADFWIALLLSIAYVSLLVFGWQWGGSDSLYEMVFWEKPDNRVVSGKEPLRDYYFVKEKLLIDSAIVYNNIGVTRSGEAEKQDTSTAHYFYKAMEEANSLLKGYTENFVGKEVSYRLANANLAKLYYNTSVNYLNQYLNDSLGQSVLTEALGILDKAYISDSIALDVIHAKGIVHYYKGSPEDTIQAYYQILDSLDYFKSIGYSPNLETLLDQQYSSRIEDVNIDKKSKQRLNVTVNYFLNASVFADAYVRITPIGKGKQPSSQNKDLEDGPGTLSFSFDPPSRSPGELESFLVEFHRRPSNDVIDSKVIDFNHDWATKKNNRDTGLPLLANQKPSKAVAFQIRGQVIDGLSRKGLSDVTITLKEKVNRVTTDPISLANATDQYGDFSFEDTFDSGLETAITVTLSKIGYKEVSLNYTVNDLIRFSNKKKWVLRMENTVAHPKMEYITGGVFERTDAVDIYAQTSPVKQSVTVSDFMICPYEVTYAAYDLFCEMTNREKADDNGWGRKQRPVTNVLWLDAVEYCIWLSKQHNLTPVYSLKPNKAGMEVRINRNADGYRLPTEAEWQYAAIGGVKGDNSLIYAGSYNIDEVAWYASNSNNQTHPIGQKKPNNAGLYDMSGNVWEWCQDRYAPYPSYAEKDPVGPDFGSHRIIKGGAWIQQASDCRIDVRQENLPTEKQSWLGFRLVRGIK